MLLFMLFCHVFYNTTLPGTTERAKETYRVWCFFCGTVPFSFYPAVGEGHRIDSEYDGAAFMAVLSAA